MYPLFKMWRNTVFHCCLQIVCCEPNSCLAFYEIINKYDHSVLIRRLFIKCLNQLEWFVKFWNSITFQIFYKILTPHFSNGLTYKTCFTYLLGMQITRGTAVYEFCVTFSNVIFIFTFFSSMFYCKCTKPVFIGNFFLICHTFLRYSWRICGFLEALLLC